MICPTCGVDNEAGSKFCMGCGTPLLAPPQPVAEPPAVPAPPLPPGYVPPPPPPGFAAPTPEASAAPGSAPPPPAGFAPSPG